MDVTERVVFGLGVSQTIDLDGYGIDSTVAVGTTQLNAGTVAGALASTATFGVSATTASTVPVGVAAGSGDAGSPSLTASMAPSGVESAVTFGTAATRAYAPATGIPSTAVTGDATVYSKIYPAGIAAGVGLFGTAKTTAGMRPGGLESGAQFGDADTVVTVFIIPGPVDPSNDFGDAVVTKRGWVFRPPTIVLGWRFQKRYEGVSVLKESGVWSEVSHPDLQRTRDADVYLAGGRDHVVGDALKAELEGQGYSVTDEVVYTEGVL